MTARLLSGPQWSLPPVFTRLLHCLRTDLWKQQNMAEVMVCHVQDNHSGKRWGFTLVPLFPSFLWGKPSATLEDTQVTVDRLRGEAPKPLARGWTGALSPAVTVEVELCPYWQSDQNLPRGPQPGLCYVIIWLNGSSHSCLLGLFLPRKTKQKEDEFHLLQEGNCTDKHHGPQALHRLCLMGQFALHPAKSFADFRATETVR